jgi:tetratricopeptide (TPR) repeat protein
MLQRNGRLAEARRWFELVLRLNPRNLSAQISLAFNGELQKGAVRALDAPLPVDISGEQRGWDRLLMEDGPFDDPQMCFKLGGVYAQGALFRQALGEFQRVHTLLPNDANAQLWQDTMEAMARFGLGDVEGAEKQALALLVKHPKNDNVLETLAQIYLHTGRFTNALATIDRQLQLDPANLRALLNKAAICIQIKDYTGAIPPLDVLLAKQPDNAPARMNRAIANLQSGKLDAAGQDYEILLKLMPEYFAVYYGLGEVALRKNDRAGALRHFENYLKYGDQGSEEYKSVADKVRQLKGGSS